MKKFTTLVISLFLLMTFVSCEDTKSTTLTTEDSMTSLIETTQQLTTQSTTQLPTLDTPTNLLVSDNIVTFDAVEHATKYRLTIYDDTEDLVGEYNVVSGFDLSLLLAYGTYHCILKATAPNYHDSVPTTEYQFSIINLSSINLLEGTEMNNQEYIRWMGRTYYSETESVKYFFFTASGFEVAFFGTSLEFTVTATNCLIQSKQPHLVVLIDGEEDPTNGTLYVLNEAENTITISGLTDGYHTIKVLKRSEASDSDTALKSIETDGYFVMPPQQKAFKVQYIAASSSTGYGNLGAVNESKTTANSNGLLAYAYLTSYLLDAETSIFSASGWGVSRGWNTGGRISETQNIPNAYVHIAIDDSNAVFTEGTFDFTDYTPDVLVVNLGTNDFNASSYSSMSAEDKSAVEETFVTDYVNFLVVLNNMYPNAKIIIAYGLMNEAPTLGDITLQVVSEANDAIGSTIVYDFLMESAGSNGNPFGCGYHPNVNTGMNVAEDLAALISQITGREVLRDMITYE